MNPRFLSAEDLRASLDYRSLVDTLDAAFRAEITVPPRHHHTIPAPAGGRDATLLLMPAWDAARHIGVKMVTVMPDNAERAMPAVNATYQLLERATGQLLALLDGPELTARRTAAASALASRYLSRPDSRRLLMVGAGVLAPHLIRAHASVRPIDAVTIWGRSLEKAERLADDLSGETFAVAAVDDLRAAVEVADIICCATLSLDPLIAGEWLADGQHLDLVGGFTPQMREADDTALTRARVFIDTPNALIEAGDLCEPLARGVITEADIQGDLFGLARGGVAGRGDAAEITLFKSAGTAIEDFAAAVLAFERA